MKIHISGKKNAKHIVARSKALSNFVAGISISFLSFDRRSKFLIAAIAVELFG
jgi:hypothetical protein